MKLCAYCNSTFIPKHGNQQYCSTNCNKSQKAATQQKLYGILKEFRKGFLTNYKLFEQLLPKCGQQTYPLLDLNNAGFKHNCYYTASIDSAKSTWYVVHNYSYCIQKKDEAFFVIVINK